MCVYIYIYISILLGRARGPKLFQKHSVWAPPRVGLGPASSPAFRNPFKARFFLQSQMASKVARKFRSFGRFRSPHKNQKKKRTGARLQRLNAADVWLRGCKSRAASQSSRSVWARAFFRSDFPGLERVCCGFGLSWWGISLPRAVPCLFPKNPGIFLHHPCGFVRVLRFGVGIVCGRLSWWAFRGHQTPILIVFPEA